jgi:hypothetical protein
MRNYKDKKINLYENITLRGILGKIIVLTKVKIRKQYYSNHGHSDMFHSFM